MTKTFRTMLAAGVAFAALGGAAQAQTLIGLTADNALVRIDGAARRAAAPMRIGGADGRVIGIDQRPQDGRLYGVTERGQIVAIDPETGRATQVSRLNVEFTSGGRAVVDFNPVANRLRLMGMNGVNFRVNVETGEVVRDGELKYQAGSPQAETRPRITAGAYTNSINGAQQTALYTLDTLARSYNLQAPPNDGVQQSRGALPDGLPPGVAFDIVSDGQGGNMGFVLAAGTLHRLDVSNGATTSLGAVAGLPTAEVIDIAAMR